MKNIYLFEQTKLFHDMTFKKVFQVWTVLVFYSLAHWSLLTLKWASRKALNSFGKYNNWMVFRCKQKTLITYSAMYC